ncbi:MAG: Formate--tetrahydrofolate ligase [Tenericutes bacterium ADurb.Bin024]|nr:MAG: Formate--tetrahydrofolate ligase [Tenericutes bacterium ADurb.Bin024]
MKNTLHILEVAKKVGLNAKDLIMYGDNKAKIKEPFNSSKSSGKLILVTAITPTPFGEGKTTMSIALHDALWKIGTPSLLCLREPSLGPVFGIKGGATGAGRAKLYPSDDINLHFTGDIHALTSSINLIAAVIDNHIFQGNALNLDPKRITWKRSLDMNDRGLRKVRINGGKGNGTPRCEEFQITVASELMAILCLASNPDDFIRRVKDIIIGYTYDGEIVRLSALQIEDAIMHLMKQALLPNLVQTLEGNPVLVHGGPFANIAHGCNSIIATKYALSKAPVVITEAGFASELGAEKFFNIKCRTAGLKPNLAVVVATIKALKMHGGVEMSAIYEENTAALARGFDNLVQHYENLTLFGVKVLVALNLFDNDHQSEVELFEQEMQKRGYDYALISSVSKGSEGGVDFANKVSALLEADTKFELLYDTNKSITEKIEIIAKKLYRASSVKYSKRALRELALINAQGFDKLPVCMAKTPLSFSDNPNLKNAPRNFTITIREFRLSAGAGFVVALTGKVLTMPGLPKVPAAVNMKEVR